MDQDDRGCRSIAGLGTCFDLHSLFEEPFDNHACRIPLLANPAVAPEELTERDLGVPDQFADTDQSTFTVVTELRSFIAGIDGYQSIFGVPFISP